MEAVTTERNYGLHFWGLVLSLLIVTLVALILIPLFLLDGKASVILATLLPLIVLAAVGIFLLWRRQRQKVETRRRQGPTVVIPAAMPEAPSAPPATAANSWFRWRRQSATSSSNSWLLWRKPPPAYSDAPVQRV